MKSIFKLERIYFSLFFVLFVVAMAITHIVQGDVNIGEKIIIREEYVENFFLLLSMVAAYFIFRLYKIEVRINLRKAKEAEEQSKTIKERLDDAFKYIGQVNVQIQEIHDLLSEVKVPESKSELKYLINYISEKTLAIVNTDWLLIRIINVLDQKTLREKVITREQVVIIKQQISNKDLLNNKKFKSLNVFTSKFDNLLIKAFFVFPATRLSKEQKVLLNTIINELEMIYLIYSSRFKKKVLA